MRVVICASMFFESLGLRLDIQARAKPGRSDPKMNRNRTIRVIKERGGGDVAALRSEKGSRRRNAKECDVTLISEK